MVNGGLQLGNSRVVQHLTGRISGKTLGLSQSLTRVVSALVVVGLGALGPDGLAAYGQQSPPLTLGEPAARLARPLTHVTAVHESRDGHLLVLDSREQVVLLVDPAFSRARPIGRIGAGPGEYRLPVDLLELGRDSIGIVDYAKRRILVVLGNGKLAGELSEMGTRTVDPVPRGAAPTGSDRQGHLYGLGYSPYAKDALTRTEAPIERWRVGAARRDTVADLPLAAPEDRILPPGQGTRALVSQPQWAVAPDGRVAVVRVEPYVVELIDATGRRIKGPVIPFRRIPVSAAHKRLWREEQGQPQPVTIMKPGQAAPTAELRRMAVFEPVQWPEFLPPFLEGALHFSREGFLWIRRTTAAGQPPLFDVVNGRGQVVAQVTIPRQTRLVGFGDRTVYLARLDADDQQFLERYRAPSLGRP